MSNTKPCAIRELNGDDIGLFRQLLAVLGRAFEEVDSYTSAQPSTAYLHKLLGSEPVTHGKSNRSSEGTMIAAVGV